MSAILEKVRKDLNEPVVDLTPEELEEFESLLGASGGFPENLFLIMVRNPDVYSCNKLDFKQQGASELVASALAVFPTEDDAKVYMTLPGKGLQGTVVPKTFEEARNIAINKPLLNALALFKEGVCTEVHWVR